MTKSLDVRIKQPVAAAAAAAAEEEEWEGGRDGRREGGERGSAM